MQRAQTDTLDDALVRLGSRMTSWVLGVGLLSLHATVFTLSMVGMLFWNLYDRPDDLWVGDVFRRWGALLAFHAIAVAAGWTAWKLLRAEQQALDATSLGQPIPVATPMAEPTSARAPWITVEPPAVEPAARRYAESTERAKVVARQVVTTWMEWSDALGRHAIRGYRATATMIRTRTQSAGATTPASDSAPDWPAPPASPAVARTDEEEFIAKFAPPATVALDESQPNITPVTDDVVIGVTSALYIEEAEPAPAPPVVKDAHTSWVEAAAATRLPRSTDDAPPADAQNGHHEPEASPSAEDGDAPPAG